MSKWTEQEEQIIAKIIATEQMVDSETAAYPNTPCDRKEAIRRLQRRKKNGIYQEPSEATLKMYQMKSAKDDE